MRRMRRHGFEGQDGVGEVYRDALGNEIVRETDEHKREVTFRLRGTLPPPVIEVTDAGTHSIYEVLGRAPRQDALIAVPRRTAAAQGSRRDPQFGEVEHHTRCGDNYCVDGIASATDPIAGWRERMPDLSFPLHPEPNDDDKEILASGPNAWVERGVTIKHVRSDSPSYALVSFVVGRASFADGAAHSNAEVSCRTHVLRGPTMVRTVNGIDVPWSANQSPQPLHTPFDEARAELFLTAVRDFLAEQGRELPTEAERDYLLDADPNAVTFCVPPEIDNGDTRMVRIRLVPRVL